MKTFSVILAFVIALFIGGNASAENWVEIEKSNDIVFSIDKDSIQRGTDSKKFPNFNRKDGFSAIIKLDFKISDSEKFDMTHLISFYEKNGERMFCFLDSLDGSNYPEKDSDILQEKVDTKGSVFPKIWEYIEKNVK